MSAVAALAFVSPADRCRAVKSHGRLLRICVSFGLGVWSVIPLTLAVLASAVSGGLARGVNVFHILASMLNFNPLPLRFLPKEQLLFFWEIQLKEMCSNAAFAISLNLCFFSKKNLNQDQKQGYEKTSTENKD